MNKKILHLQIPMNDNSARKNDLTLTPDVLRSFIKYMQKELGEDWVVVASPCIPSVFCEEDEFYAYNMKELTKEEILEMLKEESNS